MEQSIRNVTAHESIYFEYGTLSVTQKQLWQRKWADGVISAFSFEYGKAVVR